MSEMKVGMRLAVLFVDEDVVVSRWLTMARLMAVSYMEPTLLPERWRMVRDLEFRCAERLRCC
jgi:hypothetical protein